VVKQDNYKWQVLFIVMIGTLMSALDSSIVNVSIPAIMADFGASLDDIEALGQLELSVGHPL
jgi:DHA2 family multidrug resistance protein